MEQAAAAQILNEFGDTPVLTADDLEELIRQYRPRIFRFALASLRDRDAAETVTQDCFLKAHRAFGSFRNDCSMQTWLMQIIVNLVRDHVRNRRLHFWRRIQKRSEPADNWDKWLNTASESPEKQVLLKERIAGVWKAAESLSHGQRTVFLLRFVEDLDLLEIAAVTGMKEGTVKAQLFRALHSIRAQIGSAK